MQKLYFNASKKISEERKKYLSENCKILRDVLFMIESSTRNGWNMFSVKFESPSVRLRWIFKKVDRTGQSNSFDEKELTVLLNYFENILGIQKKERTFDDTLIDYMYDLVKTIHKKYYDEFIQIFRENFGKKEIIIEPLEPIMEPKEKVHAGLKYQRNKSLVDKVLKKANYNCEFDSGHKHFVSFNTGANYVEAHHLVPLASQDTFKKDLDIIENMVSLCVVCHKKIHYANIEDKIDILTYFYNLRKDGLKRRGIDLELEDFLNLYKSALPEEE